MKLVKNIEKDLVKNNVSDKEAEEAFKKIFPKYAFRDMFPGLFQKKKNLRK